MSRQGPACGFEGLSPREGRRICAQCRTAGRSICGALDADRSATLEAIVEHLTVEPRTVVVSEGEPATHIFVVTNGTLAVTRYLSDGKRQIVGFLFDGDFAGLAFHASYAYTVETLTEAALCRFPREKFARLLAEKPLLEREVLVKVSDDLIEAQNHIVLLGTQDATGRLARFLLDLNLRTRKPGGDPAVVRLTMRRSDIADYLGLSLETVSRTLTALQEQGVISMRSHGRIIRLLDAGRLKQRWQAA